MKLFKVISLYDWRLTIKSKTWRVFSGCKEQNLNIFSAYFKDQKHIWKNIWKTNVNPDETNHLLSNISASFLLKISERCLSQKDITKILRILQPLQAWMGYKSTRFSQELPRLPEIPLLLISHTISMTPSGPLLTKLPGPNLVISPATSSYSLM